MNRDEAKKLLPVIQAFAEGKDVEAWDGEEWSLVPQPDWKVYKEYRIKPEPLEYWLTIDRYGNQVEYKTESYAKTSASSGIYGPYTIHHMREVI